MEERTSITSTNTPEKPTPVSKKGTILAAIAVMVVVLVILLVTSGSNEPIVGKWRAVAIISSGDVIPVTDNSHLSIQNNGELQLHLDGISDEHGFWEVFDSSSTASPSYTVTFSDGSSAVMLYEPDDALLHLRIGSITINFKK